MHSTIFLQFQAKETDEKPATPTKPNSPVVKQKSDKAAKKIEEETKGKKQKSDKIRSPSPRTLESTVTPKVDIFFSLVKSKCSILDLMIFTIFLKGPRRNKYFSFER